MPQRLKSVAMAAGVVSLGLGIVLAEPGPRVKITIAEPTARDPVSAGAALSPARVRPGETVTIGVRIKMAPTWHINAADAPTGSSLPTTLKLKLPRGVEPGGDWTYPQGVPNPAGEGLVYEGDVLFRRTLKLATSLPTGPLPISCEVGYMACDPSTCRPPARKTVEARCEVESSR